MAKAIRYARSSASAGTGTGLYKPARAGTTRSNFHGPKLLLSWDGTPRTYNFDRTNWSVSERGRGQASTLTIEVFGFTPVAGEAVILGAGSFSNRLFEGTVVNVRQVRHKLNEGRIVYECTCVDRNYQFANKKITRKYTNQTPLEIVTDWITSGFLPSGFTAAKVSSTLTALDEIQFTMASPPSALKQLADRIGGYGYIDFDDVVHLYTSETYDAPEALTSSNPHVREFTYGADIEGLRNRILVEGRGASVTAAVLAGATSIPVDDSGSFATSGTNYAKLEAQLVSYTGVAAEAGQGCAVAGIAGVSPTAPSAAELRNDSGNLLTTGAYRYVVTFVNGSGETAPGPGSTITITAFPAPAAVSLAEDNNHDGNLEPGNYTYSLTAVNPNGETDDENIAVIAMSRFATSVAAPSAAQTSPTAAGNLAAGDYRYKTAFVNANGETSFAEAGSMGSPATISRVTPPSSAPNAAATTGGGLTPNSQYKYVVTYVDAAGETTAGTEGTINLGATENAINFTNIPVSSDPRVTARKLYRTAANGATGTEKLVTTINDNSTTSYTDTTADGSLGADDPAANTTGTGQMALTSIPLGPTGTTARKVYRTLVNNAGAANTDFNLLTTINDNSTTTYTDNTADGSLGADMLAASTADGGQVDVTLPLGATGTTSRKLYRTAVNGTARKLVTTIGDNSTTAYTDNVADGSLGADAPSSSTANGGRVTLSSIQIGPTGTTSRKVYRTTAGGATPKLLTTIADNSTTSYTDNTADGSLGADVGGGSVGAAPGDATLKVVDLSQFPAAGWVRAPGNQIISYTGRAASTGEGNLTGIPASGVGAITATISAGATVVVEPHLTGVPSSGLYSIAHDLNIGESINLVEIAEDEDSQDDYGIREEFIQDRRLSREGAQERAAAVLALLKDPRISGSVQSTDPKLRVGKPWTINITEWGLTATVTVQSVTIKPGTLRDGAEWPQPVMDVQYGSRTMDDLYTELRAIRERLAQ